LNKTDMPRIETRLATGSDAQLIALLGRITFSQTFGHLFREPQDLLNYCNTVFSVMKIESSLSEANSVFWLAFVDQLPVGYAKLKCNETSPFVSTERVCQLQKIYVLKDFLSLGIGLNLQRRLLEKAASMKFETIWLSVLKGNERALKFYTKSDFKIVGSHRFQIGQENFEFNVMSNTLAVD